MTDESKTKISEGLLREYRQLLAEKNTLRFRCDCGHSFDLEQPEKKYVRCNKETNFFIPWNDEHGRHTPILCPKCNTANKIRRLPSPWKPASGRHNNAPIDILKRMREFTENDYL